MNTNNSILIIGKNYISKRLIKTAQKLAVPIFAQNEVKDTLQNEFQVQEVYDVENLSSLVGSDTFFYINSEECLENILQSKVCENYKEGIRMFKDKLAFRNLIRKMYPRFYFDHVPLEQLKRFSVPNGKEIVVKPAKGFFGTGIRIIGSQHDWDTKILEVIEEIEKNATYFPKAILDGSVFLVEEFVDGEEYAVDMYYDNQSKPIIANIYHHPYKDKRDTRNVLYYSNSKIMKCLTPPIMTFFEQISDHIPLKNFAIHAEFRETKDGEWIPIEVNPCRFGGFGLADLTYYGYDFDPYEYFFTQKKPDWESIHKQKEGQEIGWVLGNNPDLDFEGYEADHEKFKASFSHVLYYNEMDYTKYPVFATVYAQSRDLEEFLKYLKVDFAEYFREKG